MVLSAVIAAQNRSGGEEAYLRDADVNALIYSGREEMRYGAFRNHPYLDTNLFREASLSYNGRIYPRVRLRLNTNTDELSVQPTPTFPFGIVLDPALVDSASLPEYTIVYNGEGGDLPAGYYVRLYDGKHIVMKRIRNQIDRVANGTVYEQVFVTSTRYYVLHNGAYRQAGNKRALLKLFADRKKELDRYARQQRLDFGAAPDEAIVGLVAYYETLTN